MLKKVGLWNNPHYIEGCSKLIARKNLELSLSIGIGTGVTFGAHAP